MANGIIIQQTRDDEQLPTHRNKESIESYGEDATLNEIAKR
jgi:hypothetical protein